MDHHIIFLKSLPWLSIALGIKFQILHTEHKSWYNLALPNLFFGHFTPSSLAPSTPHHASGSSQLEPLHMVLLFGMLFHHAFIWPIFTHYSFPSLNIILSRNLYDFPRVYRIFTLSTLFPFIVTIISWNSGIVC